MATKLIEIIHKSQEEQHGFTVPQGGNPAWERFSDSQLCTWLSVVCQQTSGRGINQASVLSMMVK